MLDLGACHRALDAFNQRFLDDSLPEGLSRAAFDAFDRSKYDPELIELGRSAWQLRALDEYRSQLAFTQLLADLSEMGAAFDAIGTCMRVVRDEARHVELCRRLVVALGGDDQIPGTPVSANADPSMSPMTRVMHTVLGSLCVGETFSVHVIAAVRTKVADPLAKQILTVLTADESIHSRFGWTMLEILTPHLSAEERATSLSALPWYLRMSEQAVVPAKPSYEAPNLIVSPESPFGSLAPNARKDLFFECLEVEVLQRLEAIGWPGRDAWMAAQKLAA